MQNLHRQWDIDYLAPLSLQQRTAVEQLCASSQCVTTKDERTASDSHNQGSHPSPVDRQLRRLRLCQKAASRGTVTRA
jgi:hypothetical protein